MIIILIDRIFTGTSMNIYSFTWYAIFYCFSIYVL